MQTVLLQNEGVELMSLYMARYKNSKTNKIKYGISTNKTDLENALQKNKHKSYKISKLRTNTVLEM